MWLGIHTYNVWVGFATYSVWLGFHKSAVGAETLEGAETLHNRKESKHFTTILYGVAVGVCVVVGVAGLLLTD